MAEKVEIRVRFVFVPEEADGSECYICHDNCFSSMWRGAALVGSNPKPTSLDFVVCVACHEAIMTDGD